METLQHKSITFGIKPDRDLSIKYSSKSAPQPSSQKRALKANPITATTDTTVNTRSSRALKAQPISATIGTTINTRSSRVLKAKPITVTIDNTVNTRSSRALKTKPMTATIDTTVNTRSSQSKRGTSTKVFHWINTDTGNFDPNAGSQPTQRRRRRTQPQELALLEAVYNDNHLPDWSVKEWLAKQLQMTTRAVQIWFQNRKQKARKETQVVRNNLSGGIPSSSSLDSHSNNIITIRDGTLDLRVYGKTEIAKPMNYVECADDMEGAAVVGPQCVMNEASNRDVKESAETLMTSLTALEKVTVSALINLQYNPSISSSPLSPSSPKGQFSLPHESRGFTGALPVTINTASSDNTSAASSSLKRKMLCSTVIQDLHQPQHKYVALPSATSAHPARTLFVAYDKPPKRSKGCDSYDDDDVDDSDKENWDPNIRSPSGIRQPKRRRIIRSFTTSATPLSISANHRSTSYHPAPPRLYQTTSFALPPRLTHTNLIGSTPWTPGMNYGIPDAPAPLHVTNENIRTAKPAMLSTTSQCKKPSVHAMAESADHRQKLNNLKARASGALDNFSGKRNLCLAELGKYEKVDKETIDVDMPMMELEKPGLLWNPQMRANTTKGQDASEIRFEVDSNNKIDSDNISTITSTTLTAKGMTSRALQASSTYRNSQVSKSPTDMASLLNEVPREQGRMPHLGSDSRSSSSEFESLAVLCDAAILTTEYLP
ncbi:hypothetical protein BC938DRAFT_478380 [Jimgerdemannia flammicorona]|uniref:Homeobox domain-containing protein n=1 Tax=Jimgerdemannia flammicorona TaxID=994334 RepID=A0A433QMZ6_9FUNG|nr:hypothetical protein BC938DRAFT_478380 [Jimgerdemannia flammicorona]